MNELAAVLPSVNAALNALSAVLLFLGWRAIRAGERQRHRALMLGACLSSLVFLASYFTRVALTGTHAFPGGGALRVAYLAVLGSHTVLALCTALLVAPTLWFSLRERFEPHRRVARWTLPVWLYVSVTGVVVYVMLYWVAPAVR